MTDNAPGRHHGWSIRRRIDIGALAVFSVAATLGPVAAAHGDPLPLEPRNSGGGASSGAITYDTPLPGADAPCKRTQNFTLGVPIDPNERGWASNAFVFNTVISGYAGPVTMSGSGTSGNGCESYALGGGSMVIAVEGYNELTESTLDCRDGFHPDSSSLRGIYTRVGPDMTIVLSGKCLVNRFGTGLVTFVARIQVVPSNLSGGAGVTAPVTSAKTAGVFVLAPA